MKCPNCNTENPRDARFCSECGAPLPQEQTQTRMAETQKAAGAALALGNAARQARMEAYVEPGAIISTRAYNAVMIGVVLWGLLVNVLLCTYVGDVYRYINPVAFLILYLGNGIFFEYVRPIDGHMGFYVVSVVLAFSISLIAAFLQNRNRSFDEKIHTCAQGIGDDNIVIMLFIFLLAGAFSGIASEAGGASSTANMLLSIIPGRFAVPGLFLISCIISMAM